MYGITYSDMKESVEYMEVLYRMHETTQLNIWRYSLECRKLPTRILGNTPSNAWGYSFERARTLSFDYMKRLHGGKNTNNRMRENTSVVVWNYLIGHMRTLSRIHGAFYRMHETHNQICDDTYRSTKNTHSNAWKYSIECMKSFIRVLKSAHLATWNAEYMNYSLEYMAMLARISEIISWIHWSMLSNA